MSILIKGMEMPKSCLWRDGKCPLLGDDDDCKLQDCQEDWTWEDQYKGCPLSEAPELCEDAVSRRMAIDAVKASTPFCVVPDDHHISAVDMEFRISKLPSVTPRPEPCEDAVSRADVEIEIANLLKGVFVEYEDIAKKVAARLLSVTPQRKTGRRVNNIHDLPVCDQCGYMTPYDRAIDDYEYGNYCPNCGAKMEVESHDSREDRL